jgi:hypothetical protein
MKIERSAGWQPTVPFLRRKTMMKIKLRKPVIKAIAVALAMLITVASIPQLMFSIGQAQNLLRNEPFFDFSDEFYRKNGIEPSAILAHVGTPGVRDTDWAFDTSGTDPNRKPVRIRQITGGWDKDGNLIYYVVPGFVTESTFTPDEAGEMAKAMAENFRAFLFPKTTRNPDGSIASVQLSVALPNRRQDNIFETKDRYTCENVLGLWLVAFVIYTQKGYRAWVNRHDLNHARLRAIARSNGTDLDGTPLLQRLAEIEELQSRGLIELRSNPPPGAGPPFPRWVI